MEQDERREMNDEHEEHTIASLDTSMDRYLEHHALWRKRIPQGSISTGTKRELHSIIVSFVCLCL
jgi:hypothetical protein